MSINQKIINKVKQKGLSLIEALVVLALLGGVVALIATRANEAQNEQRTQQVTAEIPEIYRGVQSRFGNEGTSGLNNQIAANLGIKPGTVRGDSTTWRHSFEGEYTLQENAADDYSFELVVTDVPTGASCTTILSENRNVGWSHITVSSTTPGSGGQVSEWGVAAVAAACAIDNNDEITITFIYDATA